MGTEHLTSALILAPNRHSTVLRTVFFTQDSRCTNQVMIERRLVLLPSALLYFWLWSKISYFDLLIWFKQAHSWGNLDDSREAHALCPEFRKVCSPAQRSKKIPRDLWFFFLLCKAFTGYFNNSSLTVSYFSMYLKTCSTLRASSDAVVFLPVCVFFHSMWWESAFSLCICT